MRKVEIEIKLRVQDLLDLEQRLPGLGARLVHPREFEDNQLFDFPAGALHKNGTMLRIRMNARGSTLTLKENPRVEDGAKVRDETEVGVGDGEAMADMLKKLGLVPVFRYQKYRTSYECRGLSITLDETPIGCFIELEGPKPAIDDMATRLGYRASDYILGSYRDLLIEHRGGPSEATGDMLFEGR